MSVARRLIAQRHLAVLLCAAALVLRLLIPTGYMVASEHGQVAITLCPGTASAGVATMHHDMPHHGKSGEHNKAEMPCAFSGLSLAMTGAADAIQIAALIAFVLAVALAGRPLPKRSTPAYLRPPMRGPPLTL